MSSPADILAVLAQAAPIVNGLADLRSGIVGAPVVDVLGFASPGDGGAGRFCWAPTCVLADDGGVVINPTGHAGVGRWVRLIDGWNWAAGFSPASIGRVNVRWFGARGDGVTDDTAAVQAAANAAGRLGAVVHLYFPGDAVYVVSQQLKLPAATRKFMVVSDPGVALKPDFIASENRGAVVYCKDVTGTLFDLWNASEGGGAVVQNLRTFGMQSMTFDAANGGTMAQGSATCTGFIPSSPPGNPPSGDPRLGIRVFDCSFANLQSVGAVALDFSRYFWTQVSESYISGIANGIGYKLASSYYATTTATIRKVIFQDCLEAVSSVSNGFSLNVDECCFESCYSALVVIDSTVIVRDAWFENMGAWPGARHETITRKPGAETSIDSVIYVRAGSLVVERPYFNFFSADGVNLTGVCECSGSSVTGAWSGGECRFQDAIMSQSVTIPFFTPVTVITSRSGFSVVVEDPIMKWNTINTGNGVASSPAAARCVSRGTVALTYATNDIRRVIVRDGLFEYDGTSALADAPSGGNLAGDRVRVPAPSAGGYVGYVCTAAGSPGTWKGYGAVQA